MRPSPCRSAGTTAGLTRRSGFLGARRRPPSTVAHCGMSYVFTGIIFVVVCIALFAWRMVRDAPTVVSGEPTPSEIRGPTGLATGDYSGLTAGVDGSAGGDGGGAALS